MVRKPPYSFKRLVNVYKVRLNIYKLNDRRIPSWNSISRLHNK